MLIHSNTFVFTRNERVKIKNVSEVVVTNFGQTALTVNERTVPPGWSITFGKCHWIPEITLDLRFRTEANKPNKVEISFLQRDDDTTRITTRCR